jgi:hypothetical protein
VQEAIRFTQFGLATLESGSHESWQLLTCLPGIVNHMVQNVSLP